MPKIISRKTIEEIVRLRDEERLSFREIGKRLNLSDDTCSKYYTEAKKKREVTKDWETATFQEVLELCKQRGISLIDLVEGIWKIQKTKISFNKLKEILVLQKELERVGGKEDIKIAIRKLRESGKKLRDLNKIMINKQKEMERKIKELSYICNQLTEKKEKLDKEVNKLIEQRDIVVREREAIIKEIREKIRKEKDLLEEQYRGKLMSLHEEIKKLEKLIEEKKVKFLLDPNELWAFLQEILTFINTLKKRISLEQILQECFNDNLLMFLSYIKLKTVYEEKVLKPLEEFEKFIEKNAQRLEVSQKLTQNIQD
ncbi:MAG: hypothetical protein QXI09_00195 [Candidatus Aenigmatarchaeota archaeon]